MTSIYQILAGKNNRDKLFEYYPRGKTGGDNIRPTSIICGVCGKVASQPYPTGIWIHGSDDNNESDHEIRKADVLESLLLLNRDENQRSNSLNEYYEDPDGTSHMSNHNHAECLIHRKYWSKIKNLNFFHNRLVGSIVTDFNYEGYTATKISNKDAFAKSLNSFNRDSERENAIGFIEFLSTNKKITKNPPFPKLFFKFYCKKGRGYSATTVELAVMESSELEKKPEIEDIIKIQGKKYEVTRVHDVFKKTETRSEVDVWVRLPKVK